uniref:Replicase n=1 Tax=Circular ssDNA virus sp. TaxID=2805939 RepID=A0A894JMH5_9VIRU|nr:replicase [Circular ssDNA virus sp.]
MPSQQARFWTMTIKGWDLFDKQDWEERIINKTEQDGKKTVRYLSIGKHTGQQTGYQHCHLNLELENRKTLTFVKNKLFNRDDMHLEVRRGTREQADGYLNKDGYFREVCNQRILQQGKRTDLDHIKELIDDGSSFFDLYDYHFGTVVRCEKGIRNYIAMKDTIEATSTIYEPPEVIVYVGPAGAGKTWHCATDPDYMNGKGYRFPVQMDTKLYFDGYDRQKTLWFDEFSGKCMQFTKFCQLTDRFGARYETKGGSVLIFGLKKILISTIQFPHLWWAGSERFNTDTEQLYRRLTKCYYLGRPRIKEDGTKEYAIPLEFNPRECCNTRDYEEILQRNVKYPSDIMEEEPITTAEEADDDTPNHEELIADITAKEKEIEELKRKLEELKQQMNDEEKPVERPVEAEKPTQPPTEPELPDTSDDEDEMSEDLLKKKEHEEKKPIKERPIKRRQSKYLFRGRSRTRREDEEEDDYCELIDGN